MDLSALIFVALAVAWAVYLVPKALRQHEEDAVNRSVEGFSDQLRVLARRDAVSRGATVLVPGSASAEAVVPEPEPEVQAEAAPEPKPEPKTAPLRPVARERAAARRAAERRRRVFTVLLMAIIVFAGLGVGNVIHLAWTTVPAGLMVAWLVLCRVMVRRERAQRTSRRRPSRAEQDETGTVPVLADDNLASDDTDEIPVVTAALLDESDPETSVGRWAPVQVPLPTYVAKAPAGRTVRTIDLDSTGVWSSGRNEEDSRLAREADAQRSADVQSDADDQERRATGS